MSLTEVDKRPNFRSVVPLPFGEHQSQKTIVNGAVTMAEMVDRFNSARGIETTGVFQLILDINRHEIPDEQKREQIAKVLGIA
jgi:hypothetical protein